MVLKKSKAYSQYWNIKNFKHWSQKWDVLFKNDKMLWFLKKPNEKLQRRVIIFLWEVIYSHFYNWDRPLDLVPVVYDLIELIIETSLWTKDYSTFDTHIQHTRVLFNKCLFHLCDCTSSNVMCMLNCLSIKPKKIFEYFICFLKVFLYFYVLSFCSKCIFLCCSSKTSSEAFSQEARD